MLSATLGKLATDEDAVDGLLAAEEFGAEFDENFDYATLHAEYRRLVAEQAALRRVAMLVAQGVRPLEIFGAVAEEKQQLPAEGSQCSNLIDSLLEERAFDKWSLWEVAAHLRLPLEGPFVVIAAQVPAVGDEPLPEIRSKLRSLDIFSAWQLLPDLQVGISHVKSDQQLDAILALLSRTTSRRVAVSARFDDLGDAPQALHIAKVMLRGRFDSGCPVALFDGSILTTAAVSAPTVMVKSARTVLNGFDDVGEEERELLFETFRVWQECGASQRATAEALFCHPNTVRYRLRKIEERTGRSLARPRDVAELCLAFEVHRRLM